MNFIEKMVKEHAKIIYGENNKQYIPEQPECDNTEERQCDDNYPFKVIEDGLEEDNDG